MRIGIKPGQLGLSVADLRRCWSEAEAAGFESVWTFDHLTGELCHEAIALLAALAVSTERVRIGCLVIVLGPRSPETLAAQLATVDALSGGRLEVGLGAGDAFARQDFDALGLPFPDWQTRIAHLGETIDRLIALTGPDSPLAARSVQTPLPLILGGASETVRRLAIARHLAWNCSTPSVEDFTRLSAGQPDPQVQVFVRGVPSVAEIVARFREAGATRLVFVLVPPIEPGAIERLARQAGL
jgi:alkanesulfonate monooxygenase SsuD/methylene tetrahydromethanopterin reductase-like flavin-dependent oxidoreductase (luciferase family)